MKGVQYTSRTGFAKVLLAATSLAALLSGFIASPAIAGTPRPVAAYSFDEGSGTTLHDSAGHNDGTISGATWTSSGKYGSALDFDGVNDLVTIPDANDLDLTHTFTLEAWVRPDTLSAFKGPISKLEEPEGKLSGYLLAAKTNNGGKPAGYAANAGTVVGASGTAGLSTGTWTHLAFTSDGTNLRLYVDGQLKSTVAAIDAAATKADLQIGHSPFLNTYFDGLIDEVRLYNEALSQSQIEADRNSEIGLDPIPVAAYSFDEGSGTTLHDSAGHNDGTISGATWTSSGKYGSALDFDGVNDLVTIPDANDLDLTHTFTLEAWVRPDTLSAFEGPISKLEEPEGKLSGYLLAAKTNNGGKPAGYAANAGTVVGASGTAGLSTGTWTHLAFTSDGTNLRLYVDGQLKSTVAAIDAAATKADLQIGHSPFLNTYFDGLIDEVRLYNEALPASEIETTANDLKGAFSTEPELVPAFDPAITDYTVRCTGKPLGVSATAASGTTISVDGQSAQSGSFKTEVELEPNQAFGISILRGSESREYNIRCLPSDFPTWNYDRLGEPSHAFYVTAPAFTGGHYVVIFDDRGVPLWWYRVSDTPNVASVLPNGTVAWTTHAAPAEIRNLDGSLVRTVQTVGTPTDAHELQELPNGNVLLIAYPTREHVDMTSVGYGSNEKVIDGEIQEIDPKGNLVWSWNSKDHIALAETARWLGLNEKEHANGWDLVHINSIEPAGEGSLIVSMRHTDAVYKIDKSTGAIVWKLGGTSTAQSLTVAGDPQSSYPLSGQHDARLLADGTVTVHDNNTKLAFAPRAVRYQIDEANHKATMVEQVVDPEVSESGCCGSARRSSDGSWLMSWGKNSLVTEFDAAGKRTFRLTFGGKLFSYRAVSVPDNLLTAGELRAGMSTMHPR